VKPLKVALIVKNRPAAFQREQRAMGWWSYPVPEFEWAHLTLGRGFTAELSMFRDYDVVVHEDGGNWGIYSGGGPPLVYLDIDSTLSVEHFEARRKIADQADLVLVEQAPLEWFFGSKERGGRWTLGGVQRASYCVNDRVFNREAGRAGDDETIGLWDVSYPCNTTGPGREVRRRVLAALTQYRDLRPDRRVDLGTYGLDDYARTMARSRVVVNWPRVPTNRSHRTFDAMACGAALVTGRLPRIEDEVRSPGEHYLDVLEPEFLVDAIEPLLTDTYRREKIAQAGYELVRARYTWAIRAAEIRAMMAEVLGI
jgi:hypothetical protein